MLYYFVCERASIERFSAGLGDHLQTVGVIREPDGCANVGGSTIGTKGRHESVECLELFRGKLPVIACFWTYLISVIRIVDCGFEQLMEWQLAKFT